MSMFHRATKEKAKLRMAIDGPSGGGKTYSALRLASHMGKKIVLIDTEAVVEHDDGTKTGAAAKYADEFVFDTMCLTNFHPQNFINAIHAAEQEGYDVMIIDSLSHAWSGTGGVLDQVDMAAKRNRTDNRFSAWKEGTPMHRSLIDAILQSKMHVICTMRSKMDFVQEKDERGKTVIRKVGLAPIQRDDVVYEFDIVGDMDAGTMVISKTRCKILTDEVIKHPGEKLAKTIMSWLNSGVAAPQLAPTKRVEDETAGPAPMKEPEQEEKHGNDAAVAAAHAALHGEPEEEVPPHSGWNKGWAAKLREARAAVSSRINAPFTEDHTRNWLKEKYGLASHKEATQEQLEALKQWMLRVHRAGRIVE